MTDTSYRATINSLEEIKKESYENLDLDRLLIYAMATLEKNGTPLYFDYISVSAFRLFPYKFSMANFKEYPDTNRISKSLRRLTDSQRKNWATGTIEYGFNLSEVGREVYSQVYVLLVSPENPPVKPVGRRTRGRSTRDDANEILTSDLYKKWMKKEEISEFQVINFLGASPYTPKSLLKNHLNNLRIAAENTQSKDAATFIRWIEEYFSNVFQD